jgi:hypothetical protein
MLVLVWQIFRCLRLIVASVQVHEVKSFFTQFFARNYSYVMDRQMAKILGLFNTSFLLCRLRCIE